MWITSYYLGYLGFKRLSEAYDIYLSETSNSNVTGLQAYNLIKKRLQHRCFPMSFAKFLRTPTLENICARLLLHCCLLHKAWYQKETCSVLGNISQKNMVNRIGPKVIHFRITEIITCIRQYVIPYFKTLNQLLNLSRTNLEICMPVLFEQLNETKQFLGNFFG